jgi:hypothetical protein
MLPLVYGFDISGGGLGLDHFETTFQKNPGDLLLNHICDLLVLAKFD